MQLLIVACLATASTALKVSGPTIAPIKPYICPPAMSSALELRGGGVVDQGMWLKAASAFFALYGIGFLLAPDMTITQSASAVLEPLTSANACPARCVAPPPPR